ncbi:MAG TPA: secretin N-terminal domain-containing protein [Longimicrobium sp.]
MKCHFLVVALAGALCTAPPLRAQTIDPGRGVTIDFADTELRAVVQSLARYLDRPVLFSAVGGQRVSLRTPHPVEQRQVVSILRSLLDSNGFELVEDSGSYVVRQRGQPAPALASTPPFSAAGPPQGVVATGSGVAELFVIPLRHARAADVAATVNALYGRGGALGELGARDPLATLSDALRANRIPAGADQSASISGGVPASTGTGGFRGEVVIVPDARTNSLLVRASRADYELVQAAVRQVDIRPLQVIIEVAIAEVRRNSEFSYALSASVGQTRVRGSGNTTVAGRLEGAAREDLLVDVRGLGGVDLNLTLRAGVARGVVSILSRPIIFAANNEQAEINVGDQRPFVQLQRTTDGGARDQVVQYKDVGTRLVVLPTISADGYVQLSVTQEVNNATAETGPQNAPVISTRSIRTALLVRDGQTVVLGGLAEAQSERGISGVPVLSSIPVIGGLFGSRSRANRGTELFVFLTPRIVRDDAGLGATTRDVQQNAGAPGKTIRKTPPLILPRPGKLPGTARSPVQAAPIPPPSDPETEHR